LLGMENKKEEEIVKYGFSIEDTDEDAKMKKIIPSVFSHFYGIPKEDLETFLFEFEVLCQTCEYKIDAQKLSPSL